MSCGSHLEPVPCLRTRLLDMVSAMTSPLLLLLRTQGQCWDAVVLSGIRDLRLLALMSVGSQVDGRWQRQTKLHALYRGLRRMTNLTMAETQAEI